MNERSTASTEAVRRWLDLAVRELRASADILDAINVFPVADSDTGTNLVTTVGTAAQAVQVLETPDVGELISLAGQAALDDARGNSGSLFAVWLCAVGASLEGRGLTADAFAQALSSGELRSWSALTDPVPGTMLSVIRDIAAVQVPETEEPGSKRTLLHHMERVVAAAREAVLGSTEELEVLQGSGRVDAGALGMLIILDALRRTAAGEGSGRPVLWAGAPEDSAEPTGQETGVQVQQLLDRMRETAADGAAEGTGLLSGPAETGVEVVATVELTALEAATVRFELTEIGRSVITSPISQIEGELWRWRVHVHVDDRQAALDVLRAHGTPRNVAVTGLDPEGSGRQSRVNPSDLD